MEAIQKIVDHLKADNVFEAMDLIKVALSERSQKLVQESRIEVAESFGLIRVVEAKSEEDETEDDESEEDGKEKDNKDE